MATRPACAGCGQPMERERLPRGKRGFCVRCPDCRWRARCYLHGKLRRRAREYLREKAEPGPYLRRFLNHKCDRMC